MESKIVVNKIEEAIKSCKTIEHFNFVKKYLYLAFLNNYISSVDEWHLWLLYIDYKNEIINKGEKS